MPRMFRIMKRDDDGMPKVGESATTLGVRAHEVDLDADGNAIPGDKGMSVNPRWQDAPLSMIPKRFGTGGRGSDTNFCFCRGEGEFKQGPCGPGLELLPDSPTHGIVRPAALTPRAMFVAALHATRSEWVVDE